MTLSLCILGVLCVSAVVFLLEQIHHRGTEFTEIAQRLRLFRETQSLSIGSYGEELQ
jgi:hypothetical protein